MAEQSKWKTWVFSIIYALILGFFWIIMDKLIENWWESPPTDQPPREPLAISSTSEENGTPPVSVPVADKPPPPVQGCDKATQLVKQANELGRQPDAQPEPLLREALQQCPNHADAWHQLGVFYDQQKQWPLSLEAYSHICQTHQVARDRITYLLQYRRYATVEADNIFKSATLSVIYDKQRLQAIENRLLACKFLPVEDPPKTENAGCETIKSDDLNAQLKCLHNPQPPFTISLWLDERGKKHFSHHQTVTIGYEINGLKTGSPAYLTLVNISPAGQMSMIVSEPVEVGKVHGQLTAQSSVTTVNQTQLEAGQEYFKAIVTAEPIDWKAFITAATKGKPKMTFWGTAELTVEVD